MERKRKKKGSREGGRTKKNQFKRDNRINFCCFGSCLSLTRYVSLYNVFSCVRALSCRGWANAARRGVDPGCRRQRGVLIEWLSRGHQHYFRLTLYTKARQTHRYHVTTHDWGFHCLRPYSREPWVFVKKDTQPLLASLFVSAAIGILYAHYISFYLPRTIFILFFFIFLFQFDTFWFVHFSLSHSIQL